MAKITTDPEMVRAFIDYNPETGKFWWKRPDAKWFKNPHAHAIFMGQRAGRETMNVDRGNGYMCGGLSGRFMLAHRVAWCITYGAWPDHQIDHINGDRSDNRLCNLREALHGENSMNRGMLRSNTSGYKGVSLHKKSGMWRASIKHYGVKQVKYFHDKEEANNWRIAMGEAEHGKFCNHG